MSGISSIGSKVVNIAARGTGVAALGLTLYDSHVLGKLEADSFSQSKEADRVTDAAQNMMYQETPSAVTSAIKKKVFAFQLENNIFQAFNQVAGYAKGFASMLVSNCVPAILGTLALFGKGKTIPRASALGLVVYGGYQILKEGFGIGKINRLNPPYKDI